MIFNYYEHNPLARTEWKTHLPHQPLTLLLAVLLVAFIFSCAPLRVETTYYLIEYLPRKDNPVLILREPIPKRVLVSRLKIPRSFDSIRIIARYSSHQINYYRYNLWAVRPHIAIADLLVQHINTYQLFQKCQQEFLGERPDYEITGEVIKIEHLTSAEYAAAHLQMSLELFDYEQGKLLVRHSFDREIRIPDDPDVGMTMFAKAVSDMVDQEIDNFLVKVVNHSTATEELQGK